MALQSAARTRDWSNLEHSLRSVGQRQNHFSVEIILLCIECLLNTCAHLPLSQVELVDLRARVIFFLLQEFVEHFVELSLVRETVNRDLHTNFFVLIVAELNDNLLSTNAFLLLIENFLCVVDVGEAVHGVVLVRFLALAGVLKGFDHI